MSQVPSAMWRGASEATDCIFDNPTLDQTPLGRFRLSTHDAMLIYAPTLGVPGVFRTFLQRMDFALTFIAYVLSIQS